MSDNDDRLQQHIADTLERSLDNLDADTLQKLHNIRLQAQQQPQRNWRPALALAASVLVMIAIPWMMQGQPQTGIPVATLDEAYLSVDPDMLADWEMLEAIGEVPDA